MINVFNHEGFITISQEINYLNSSGANICIKMLIDKLDKFFIDNFLTNPSLNHNNLDEFQKHVFMS